MSLTKLTANLNMHQSKPDKPVDTASKLKEDFDKPVNDIKSYINESLISELDTLLTSLQNAVQTLQTTVQTNRATLSTEQLNILFPVGYVYISVSSTNPSSTFGGTWEQIKDKFLLSAGDTYEAGDTGGEATHTLTIDEIPPHTHKVRISADTGWNGIAKSGGSESTNEDTYQTGGGQAHNNMPPYLTVYVWKRIA